MPTAQQTRYTIKMIPRYALPSAPSLLPNSAAVIQKSLVSLILLAVFFIGVATVVIRGVIGSSPSTYSPWTRASRIILSDELSDHHIYTSLKDPNATKTWPRPRFHVLVDARPPGSGHRVSPHRHRINLCRTLLSAVVQGYPPPILVGHRPEGWEEAEAYYEPNSQDKKSSPFEYFLEAALNAVLSSRTDYPTPPEGDGGKLEEEKDNVILLLGKDHWVQMPAEVTVRRFLQHKEVLSRRLASTYNSLSRQAEVEMEEGGKEEDRKKPYHLGVLFPASKKRACFFSGSSFRQYNYGNITNTNPDTKEEQNMQKLSVIKTQHDILLPESSLPEDVYRSPPSREVLTWPTWGNRKRKQQQHQQDLVLEARCHRPRYLGGGGSFIGSAEDVERLLRGAMERVNRISGPQASPDVDVIGNENEKDNGDGRGDHDDDAGEDEMTCLFSQAFYEQEFGRKSQIQGEEQEDEALDNDGYEFGIGLDYESRVFQDMAEYYPNVNNNIDRNITNKTLTTSDVRFLKFDNPNIVRSPSKTAAHLYHDPILLPPELLHPLSPEGRSSPFGLTAKYISSLVNGAITSAATATKNSTREQKDNPEEEDKQQHNPFRNPLPPPKEPLTLTIPWPTLQYTTNIIVPRGSIPSILDMRLDSDTVDSIQDEHWAHMWFSQQQPPAARDLLDEYLHPNPHVYAIEAAYADESWWNMRGGRGGVWTDQGIIVIS